MTPPTMAPTGVPLPLFLLPVSAGTLGVGVLLGVDVGVVVAPVEMKTGVGERISCPAFAFWSQLKSVKMTFGIVEVCQRYVTQRG